MPRQKEERGVCRESLISIDMERGRRLLGRGRGNDPGARQALGRCIGVKSAHRPQGNASCNAPVAASCRGARRRTSGTVGRHRARIDLRQRRGRRERRHLRARQFQPDRQQRSRRRHDRVGRRPDRPDRRLDGRDRRHGLHADAARQHVHHFGQPESAVSHARRQDAKRRHPRFDHGQPHVRRHLRLVRVRVIDRGLDHRAGLPRRERQPVCEHADRHGREFGRHARRIDR